MKKSLLLITLFFCTILFYTNNYAAQDQSLDEIIATVNEDVITKSELNRSLAIVKMQLLQSHLPKPEDKILKKQVLDQLINKKLQLQMARQANVYVNDEDLDNAVEAVARRNNVSVDDLYQRIARDGMSKTDYREEMRDQLILKKIQEQELISHITMTSDEVTNFLRSKNWINNASKEYRIEDILIPTSDTPSPEELLRAKQRAQNVLAKLKQKMSFKMVAQMESGEKHALQGGDLGFRKLPEIPSAFSDVVVHMKLNEVAGPIQTPNGFHIIRLVDERTDSSAAAPDRRQVENLLFQRKFEEALQNWISRLRSQAFINSHPETA